MSGPTSLWLSLSLLVSSKVPPPGAPCPDRHPSDSPNRDRKVETLLIRTVKPFISFWISPLKRRNIFTGPIDGARVFRFTEDPLREPEVPSVAPPVCVRPGTHVACLISVPSSGSPSRR